MTPMTASAYEVAKAGGAHENFLRDYSKLPDHLIEKAIRSINRVVAQHEVWIADPKAKLGQGANTDRMRRLADDKWPKDIARQREQIDILRAILKERKK